ncbi:hypothetical protein ACFPN0_21830 [Kitasatospora cinereorecta]
MTRDAEEWKHVEVFLAYGPEVLAGVRAAAHGADYVEGPVSADLRRLRGIDTTLERAGRIRHEWDQIMALMDDSLPGSREIYASREPCAGDPQLRRLAPRRRVVLPRTGAHPGSRPLGRASGSRSGLAGRPRPGGPRSLRSRHPRDLARFASRTTRVEPEAPTSFPLTSIAPSSGGTKPTDRRILVEHRAPHPYQRLAPSVTGHPAKEKEKARASR